MAAASPLIEICVDSAGGAAAAAAGGADRIELCAALSEGGLTPSVGLLRAARRAFAGDVVVLVRPRRGDFLYSLEEQRALLDDVLTARAEGAQGIAIGALTKDGAVDRAVLAPLIEAARPLAVTFHRAFDFARDPAAALEATIDLGCARLLTSGGAPSAPEGAANLAELVRRAGGRIEIVAGGGVRPENAAALLAASGVPAVHSSARAWRQSLMLHVKTGLALAGAGAISEYELATADAAVIRALREALAGIRSSAT